MLLCSRAGFASDESSNALEQRALAAAADIAQGRALYEQYCTRCHEARGSGGGDREIPQLAGQQRRYLLTQLVRIIALERSAPMMHRVLARGNLSAPQALSDMTAYLAAQPHDSHGEHGDALRLGRGRELYSKGCAACHGALGNGRQDGAIPAIAGQNYTYLVEQMNGFDAGHRSEADPAVIDAVRKLAPEDIKAVADFMSRLPESADPRYGEVL